MKVISVANQKGGVSKTSTTLAIGSYFLNQNKRVLFIDMDSQHNLSSAFGYDTNGSTTVYDVLINARKIKNVIHHTDNGDIILGDTNLVSPTLNIKRDILKNAISEVSDLYDFVIIDTPPALGTLLITSLVASDGVVVPTVAETFAQDGINEFILTIDAVKKKNPNIRIYGFLLTRYNQRTVLHRIIKDEMTRTASVVRTKVFNSKIRNCISVAEAQRMQEPNIFKYAPKSNAAIDYTAFCKELELLL